MKKKKGERDTEYKILKLFDDQIRMNTSQLCDETCWNIKIDYVLWTKTKRLYTTCQWKEKYIESLISFIISILIALQVSSEATDEYTREPI